MPTAPSRWNGAPISGATIDETGTGSDVDVKAGSTITGGASLNDGDVSIESGQTLTLGNVTVSGATFNFFGFGDTLKIGQPSSFNGAIAGLASGDAIDLTSVTYGSNGYSVWTQTSTTNGGTGILQIYDGSALQATLDLTGIYSQGDFTLTADGSQGTDVNIGNVNINHVSFYSGTINSNGVYTPQILKGGGSLQLTNGNGGEAASWFANTTYSISSLASHGPSRVQLLQSGQEAPSAVACDGGGGIRRTGSDAGVITHPMDKAQVDPGDVGASALDQPQISTRNPVSKWLVKRAARGGRSSSRSRAALVAALARARPGYLVGPGQRATAAASEYHGKHGAGSLPAKMCEADGESHAAEHGCACDGRAEVAANVGVAWVHAADQRRAQ